MAQKPVGFAPLPPLELFIGSTCAPQVEKPPPQPAAPPQRHVIVIDDDDPEVKEAAISKAEEVWLSNTNDELKRTTPHFSIGGRHLCPRSLVKTPLDVANRILHSSCPPFLLHPFPHMPIQFDPNETHHEISASEIRAFRVWCIIVRALYERETIYISAECAVRSFFQITEEVKTEIVKAYGVHPQCQTTGSHFANSETLAAHTRKVMQAVPFTHATVPGRPSVTRVRAFLVIATLQMLGLNTWSQVQMHESLISGTRVKDIRCIAGCGALLYVLNKEFAHAPVPNDALNSCVQPSPNDTKSVMLFVERTFQCCRAWDFMRIMATKYIKRWHTTAAAAHAAVRANAAKS
jgi:hypothetical protein